MADYARFPFPRDLHARWKAEAALQGKTLTGLLRDVITALEETRDEKCDETPITSTTVGASWSAESTTPVDHNPGFMERTHEVMAKGGYLGPVAEFALRAGDEPYYGLGQFGPDADPHDGVAIKPEGETEFDADAIRAKLGHVSSPPRTIEPYVSEHVFGSDEWWQGHPLFRDGEWAGEVNPFGSDAHYMGGDRLRALKREIQHYEPEG
ncbi:hypothetical protein SEA_PUPPER_1 [Gordonia phage Pupper]|uniref:Uncharacterized protein n=1 Tax=Gordonia phage Pupper TaxID=2571249 RepID=A0A4Y6EIC4_9CAUD|nr:hypothetical protein KHQ83_gp001 [Gordonia phage Pupper]QDF18488.1 hypothetical protein SEA_PUPPER_1 [Gordonia phage Pupper]QDF18721.1 hypothetical protein SEA_SCENTAE_1 [Gordonia phage SCentae]